MAFNNIPPNGFPALPDIEDLEAVEKDVTTLKTSVLGLTQDVTDLNAQKANQITIAPFFNSETSYDVGDLVYYNGLSYRCTNSHEGEWDTDDFAPTTIANELSSLMSGLTNVETSLTSMNRVISFPFTMPNDSSSRAVNETIEIDLSATVPETAYMIGVSVHVFAQKRTIVGAYFQQASFDANHLYLIDVLKAIPSYYDGVSGYLIVGIPHT